VVFGASSAVAAWSGGATALIACRAAMGVGAACILPATLSIVTNVFTVPKERAQAFGWWTAAGGVGLTLGPVIGGALLSHFWWGSVFLVNVPFVIVAVAAGWWAIPESRNPEAARLDPVGVILSIIGVSGLVWATIEAPTHGWGSRTTLASFAGALVVLGCFVRWENHCAAPMLELAFFRNLRFSIAALAASAGHFAFSGTLFVLTQELQFILGYSPAAAGIRLTPLAAMFVVLGLVSPRVAERIGTKVTVAMGLSIFAIGLLVLSMAQADWGYGPLVVPMLVIGVGFGLMLAPATEAIMGSLPREKAGLGSGTSSTTRQLAIASGVAVCGSLLASRYDAVLAERTEGLPLSRGALDEAHRSVGGALQVARDVGGATGRSLDEAARVAFVHGMRAGLLAGVAFLVVTAALTLRYLPARAARAVEIEEYQPVDVIVE
jgi:MFS family permease